MCMATFVPGSLVVATDFIEKFKHEAGAILTCSTAPSTTLMVAIVHHSPDGSGRHETDAWVFASSDPNHDFDFHIYAMDVIFKHYMTGEGRAATAGVEVPTVHTFTDGCGKQYKGKRNFQAVAESLRRLGVRLVHNFAVTSHFKGAHDGIGGLMKNLMRNAEKRGQRIHDTTAAFNFLKAYAEEQGGDSEGYFSSWSPYRVKRFHVRQLGFNEIPRPPVELTGIAGSSKLYQFMGVEEQNEMQGVCVGVQTVNSSVVVDGESEKVANPTKWFVRKAFPSPKKITKEWKLRVRKATCYCSSCRVGAFSDCGPAKMYPDLVGHLKEVVGKEKIGVRSLSSEADFK